jgi:hypothetical protein
MMTRVLMVLARGPDHPEGNLTDRLDLQVHLTAQGMLDAVAWETGHTPWLTSRQRSDHPRRDGELVKLEDGWAIRNLDREDDPLLAFSASLMRPGEVARVTRLDGEELTYRIVSVEAG